MKIDLTDIEWPAKLQEERYAISPNEIEKIMDIASFNRKGYYLALISSGARPAEVLGLRLSDIELLNGKYKALIPTHLTKKKMARTVFFSREVTPYLTQLIKKCTNDTPFTRSKNPKVGREAEDKTFRHYCNKLGDVDSRFLAKYETTGYHKINMYCFRGYFFTKTMRVVGDDTAHAMIGHGAYLQQYQRRTDQEKKELWDEIEPEVLLFDKKKAEAMLEKETEKNARDIESMRNENQENKRSITRLTEIVKQLGEVIRTDSLNTRS